MTKLPVLSYREVLRALQRAGRAVVRQRGSHIRLEKATLRGIRQLTVPAHTPLKRSTLAAVLKASGLSLEEFLELL